jgi:hypothetical protein
MPPPKSAAEEHAAALRAAAAIAEAEALARMRGEFPKRFDTRGIHPWSEEWGRIHALEDLHPELAEARGGEHPVSMRQKAEAAARRRFAEQLLAEHAVPVE